MGPQLPQKPSPEGVPEGAPSDAGQPRRETGGAELRPAQAAIGTGSPATEAAFRGFCDRNIDHMGRVIRNITPGHEVDDILQDTLVKVFRHRGELANIQSERAWATTLATRAALDYLKRRRRIRAHEVGVEVEVRANDPSALEVLEAKSDLALVEAAVAQLKAGDRRLLQVVIETEKYAEAAAVLASQADTVRGRASTIRRILRGLANIGPSRRKP